jgi:hypothetical protein
MNAQSELFESSKAPAQGLSPTNEERKIFRGANGIELTYWEEGGNITRVAFSDKLIVAVTKQRGGHIYAKVPGFGRLEKRNKISFLSAAALIARALEINSSVGRQLKEQRKILLAASEEIRPGVAAVRPRFANKLAGADNRHAALKYINPFSEDWNFAKLPDWLLRRPELTKLEKLIYGRLLFPQPPICKQYDRATGTIFELDQDELAKSLGAGRKAVGTALKSLRNRPLLDYATRPGAKLTIRFLWHPWIQTCGVTTQVKTSEAGPSLLSTCGFNGLAPVSFVPSTCVETGQDAPGIEKKDNKTSRERELLAPNSERELLGEIAAVVGATEMKKNGGMWRMRIRRGAKERRALRNSIEDYKIRTPDQRAKIHDLPAWFTDRYQHNLIKIDRASGEQTV